MAYESDYGKRQGQLINAVLSACTKPATIKEVIYRVSRQVKREVSYNHVHQIMSHIRANADTLGWSVTYSGTNEDRLYQVVFHGMKKLTVNERTNVKAGSYRALKQSAKKLHNIVSIFERATPAMAAKEQKAFKVAFDAIKYAATATDKAVESYVA